MYDNYEMNRPRRHGKNQFLNICIKITDFHSTVEPRYKEVKYITKPSYNKVSLLVPVF